MLDRGGARTKVVIIDSIYGTTWVTRTMEVTAASGGSEALTGSDCELTLKPEVELPGGLSGCTDAAEERRRWGSR